MAEIPHSYDFLFSSMVNNYKYLNIELMQLRHVKVGKEWNYTPHDNVNRLYFILSGQGELCTKTDTLTLKPHHIYLIPAQFHFTSRCDTCLEKLYAHFKVTILPDRDLLSGLDHIVEIDSSREEIEQLKAMFYKGDIESALTFRLWLNQVVRDLMGPLAETYANDLALYLKFEKFFSFTASHPYADLSIDDICKNIGASPRQLSYHYKTATGQSIKSYLNTLLLNRLKFLLLTTNRSIRDISADLHFNNEFYCSRFFKKHVGLSPREFRQMKD